MARTLHLRVLTPAETLLEVERADWVQVRLADGAGISIYPGHAPLLAETVTSTLRYGDASGEHTFDLEAGILQIENNEVIVFTSGTPEAVDAIEPSVISRERQFERLAQELQTRLKAERKRILETSREG